MAKAKTDTGNRVAVTIPRAVGREDPNYFVGINGKNYLMPKGQTTEVPPEVAAEIARSNAAIDAMYDNKDELLKKAVNPI